MQGFFIGVSRNLIALSKDERLVKQAFHLTNQKNQKLKSEIRPKKRFKLKGLLTALQLYLRKKVFLGFKNIEF